MVLTLSEAGALDLLIKNGDWASIAKNRLFVESLIVQTKNDCAGADQRKTENMFQALVHLMETSAELLDVRDAVNDIVKEGNPHVLELILRPFMKISLSERIGLIRTGIESGHLKPDILSSKEYQEMFEKDQDAKRTLVNYYADRISDLIKDHKANPCKEWKERKEAEIIIMYLKEIPLEHVQNVLWEIATDKALLFTDIARKLRSGSYR
jgi:hypothetical protein